MIPAEPPALLLHDAEMLAAGFRPLARPRPAVGFAIICVPAARHAHAMAPGHCHVSVRDAVALRLGEALGTEPDHQDRERQNYEKSHCFPPRSLQCSTIHRVTGYRTFAGEAPSTEQTCQSRHRLEGHVDEQSVAVDEFNSAGTRVATSALAAFFPCARRGPRPRPAASRGSASGYTATSAPARRRIGRVSVRHARRSLAPTALGILALRPGGTQQTGQCDNATHAQGAKQRSPVNASLGDNLVVAERLLLFRDHDEHLQQPSRLE